MLHEDRGRFFRLIAETARFMRMPEATVEKDHYVMLLLGEIVKRDPDIGFV